MHPCLFSGDPAGNRGPMSTERACVNCGVSREGNLTKCLVDKEDDCAHGEGRCRFACIECGHEVQEGWCLRRITLTTRVSMQAAEPVEVEEQIASLVGNIIVTFAQAERVLSKVLPPSCRGKRAIFSQDIQTLRRIMPRIDRSQTPWRDNEWYEKIKRLYDRVAPKRNALAHGALLSGVKTSFVVGSQERAGQEQDEALPMTMVGSGEPGVRVKLTEAELEPILLDVKQLLRLIALH